MKRKWNWIDTAIILVIVLAAVGFLNRDKILNRENNQVSNKREILITVEAEELNDDVITQLKIGDKIFSQYKLQDAEIVEFVVNPSWKTQVGPDGEIKYYEDEYERTLVALIKANAVSSGPYIDLGGQEIKVGLSFILKTTDFEALSEIKHIEVAQ
ncbi:MAG: DUF4330 domain-containing protein [Gudongella sp.]|nr:DUF4330 domain-containing protein [Gudongella sp.]